jgi:hypothetical protein
MAKYYANRTQIWLIKNQKHHGIFQIIIKELRTQSVKRNQFMMFPVCLITKMTISTHIANNLPDG